MPNAISISIPGPPVPKARARIGKGHAYTPERTATAEIDIGYAMQQARTAAGQDILQGPLAVNIVFIFKPPISWPKKRKIAALGTPHTQKPDLDNLVKILDSGNAVLWNDDAQIWRISATKEWGVEARTEIVVQPLVFSGMTVSRL
jgi:Holliday junction resolvase RusA-like endonuclease